MFYEIKCRKNLRYLVNKIFYARPRPPANKVN